ncbi:MAG: aminotransferase [Rhodospirillales bacterium]
MINPLVSATEAPPIAEAAGWLKPERFGADTPLIDVCQAVPGYGPPESLSARVAGAAAEDATAFYTPIAGIAPLREALADDVNALYGGDVRPAEVLITSGCNQAFVLAMIALAGSGSSVLLPAPWYFNHAMTLGLLGIEAIALPCRPGNAMIPDPADAARLMRDDTRAIVLVTPNNPTGAIYPPGVMAAFLDLAAERGVALVTDETYRDFLPPETGRPHGLFAERDWRRDGLIHLYSFSKVYSLTGYRVGAIVAASRTIAEIEKVMDCVAICAPHISQRAALYGLEELADWRAANRTLMANRVEAFRDAMKRADNGFAIRSIGAYFAYVEHPYQDRSSLDVAKSLAAEKNLLCLPGTMFGPAQERMLRFAFANVDESVMPAIAERLGR